MASITSLMNSSSSTSSLYGNRNIISGLASGMDTEAMIENSVSGYKTKITNLQQKMTKLQWKQDAYRSLIAQMNNVLNKYADYTSSTNLFSSSFFKKAVSTVANGANAAKVAVTGKGTSDVQIDRIKQLAQAASYSVDASHLAKTGATTTDIKWDEPIETNGVSGSVTIQYGGGGDSSKGTQLTLRLDESKVYKTKQEVVDALNEQLKSKQINGKGADEYITAWVDGDKIALQDLKGNAFEITSVGGDMEKLFEKGKAEGHNIYGKVIQEDELIKKIDRADYLKDQTLSISLDGRTKTINLKDIIESDAFKNATNKSQALAQGLDQKIAEEFGSGKVSVTSDGDALKFDSLKDGSTLTVSGNNAVNEAMGLGEGGYSNVLQNSWTLERVLGKDFTFEEREDKDGNKYQAVDLTINGEKIELKSTDTIQNMMDKINSSKAGVTLKYSTLTGEFSMTAKETGVDSQIKIEGELGKALFGDTDAVKARYDRIMQAFDDIPDMQSSDPERWKRLQDELKAMGYKAGQDAEFTVTVNGKTMEMSRSSNEVDLDGYKVTLKGAFGYKEDGSIDSSAEAITFKTNTDSDKIVNAIKDFVKDYNEMVTAIHSAYRTEPLKNTNKEEYMPLTDDDKNDMSESAVKAYEDKAKTGLLYADSDLANLYSKLTSAIQGGSDGGVLRSIGLNITYSEGLSTISLDEDALRSALESDPDKVSDAFTKTVSGGADKNGLMYNIRSTLQQYGSTSIGSPGILVNKAGSTLSSYSLNNNELNDQINAMQEEIDKWQERMSDRVDYYTNQFTQLELLINQMNSQSSMLAGLSGGM